MRCSPGEARDDAQRAVAAAFDVGGGGLAQEGEVAGEPLRVVALDASQAVEVGGDFLVVVEDPGDVCRERRVLACRDQRADLAGEGQGRRAAAEHVD